jgi:hypothetical protein
MDDLRYLLSPVEGIAWLTLLSVWGFAELLGFLASREEPRGPEETGSERGRITKGGGAGESST